MSWNIEDGQGGSLPSAPTRNESLNGTGVNRGGVISVLSGTQLDITAGFGEIMSTDNPLSNTTTRVQWNDDPITVDVTTDGLYILICDELGEFSQITNTSYTNATRRDFLTFGAFTVDGGVLVSCTPFVISSNEPIQQFFDLLNCLGTIRCSGLNVSPIGANMQVQLSSGVIHAVGSGAQLGGRSQNLTTINGQSPVVFNRLLGKTDDISATSVNVIDPDFYDNGTGAPVSIGGANKATIKYVFLLPSPNVSVAIMYGQTVYNSLADAVAAGADDGIVVPPLYANNALLVGRIAVASGATDLSDLTKAKFLSGAKFGSGLSGGISSGLPSTTGGRGTISTSNNTTSTNLGGLGSWVNANLGGGATLAPGSSGFGIFGSRLVYTGQAFDGLVIITFVFTRSGAVGNYSYNFSAGKNSAQIGPQFYDNFVDTPGRYYHGAITAPVSLVNNDTVELRIIQTGGIAENVTIRDCTITAM